MNRTIAYFITPHGYGHAARAAAIMAAIQKLDPMIRFEIFTKVPEWFFQESLPGSYAFHRVLTDIGLVQESPLKEDLPATIRSLDQFYPPDNALVASLARELIDKHCRLVVCDIAPLGILVAKKANMPSVLVENFTWDWIYEDFLTDFPDFTKHIQYLKELFNAANYHIQTEPVCLPVKSADLTTPPVSREPKSTSVQVRKKLGIPPAAKVVLITMGGFKDDFQFLDKLEAIKEYIFVIPGASFTLKIPENIIALPHHSNFYHPDLIQASDAVIGKTGYSTVAEVYRKGIPFGYVSRRNFRESKTMEDFILQYIGGIGITENGYFKGGWIDILPRLVAIRPQIHNRRNGAAEAAEFILTIL
jgi:hypothetical protein